jgi:2-iminobutanoate/2-iminopropanoate deaminase
VEEIRTSQAPEPVGPYSQAIRQGGWIFASGQIPLDPATQELVSGEIEDEAAQAIANLSAVLRSGGSSLGNVLRTTLYLTDLTLFPRVNAVYARHFTGSPAPARATVQVAALPLGARVEIDAIALVSDDR